MTWRRGARRARIPPKNGTHQQVVASIARRRAALSTNSPFAAKNLLTARPNNLFRELPNFARACGRVSVGRYPDKRPDSRLRKEQVSLLRIATGSRRRN